jgi:TPR repeat protein
MRTSVFAITLATLLSITVFAQPPRIDPDGVTKRRPFDMSLPEETLSPASLPQNRIYVHLPANAGFTPDTLKKAQFGDPVAQTVIGWAYATGKGVNRDAGQAVRWLQRAAVEGSITAQFCLGVIYMDDSIVRKDTAEAYRWLSSATQLGDHRAEVDLALLYLRGEGVAQNYGRAIQLFQQAAKHKIPAAEYNVGAMYERGLGVNASTKEAI